MTCGTTHVGGVPFAGFAMRQAVQSKSSGEAEFYIFHDGGAFSSGSATGPTTFYT